MLVLTCCQSAPKIEYKTVYVYPELYFPKYPGTSSSEVPLDENFKVVKSDTDENGDPLIVEWVLTPFWLYKLRTDYKLSVDKAEIEYKTFIKSVKN